MQSVFREVPVAAPAVNQQSFQVDDLVGEVLTNRTLRFKRFMLEFSATVDSGSTGFVFVFVSFWDPATSEWVQISGVNALSTVNPTRMTVVVPAMLSRWFSIGNQFLPIMRISYRNLKPASTMQTMVRINTVAELQPDTPSVV